MLKYVAGGSWTIILWITLFAGPSQEASATSILKEGVAKDLRSDNGAGYGNKHPKSKP